VAAFVNRIFIVHVGLEIGRKDLLSFRPLGSPRAKLPAISGAHVSNTSNASKGSSSMGAGVFNQIVLFSASGLAMSMAFVFVGDVRILYPWF
jgi:hypothetical protein